MTGFTAAHPFSLPWATPSRRIPLGSVLIQAVHFIVYLKMAANRIECLSQLGIYGISTCSDEITQPNGKRRTDWCRFPTRQVPATAALRRDTIKWADCMLFPRRLTWCTRLFSSGQLPKLYQTESSVSVLLHWSIAWQWKLAVFYGFNVSVR